MQASVRGGKYGQLWRVSDGQEGRKEGAHVEKEKRVPFSGRQVGQERECDPSLINKHEGRGAPEGRRHRPSLSGAMCGFYLCLSLAGSSWRNPYVPMPGYRFIFMRCFLRKNITRLLHRDPLTLRDLVT